MTEATIEQIPAELKADMDLMDKAAAELSRITERTEFTLSVITQAIRTQEAIAKGKVLIQLRDTIPDGEWIKFLNREDVRIGYQQALHYINAAQLMLDAEPLYGEEMLLNFSTKTLAATHLLPTEAKLEVLEQAESTGAAPTEKQVREIAKKPEVKLSLAAEKLADAKNRKANAAPNSSEKASASTTIKKYEDRILQLESEIEREKQQKVELSDGLTSAEDDLHVAQKKLEKAQSELANAMEEADKLRFDEDTARAQRISRVGNQLVLTLPQTLADVQKFVADRSNFQEKTHTVITDQIKTLLAYLNEHFTEDTIGQ